MKKLVFLAVAFSASFAMVQDLLSNPEPGKCYMRCTITEFM